MRFVADGRAAAGAEQPVPVGRAGAGHRSFGKPRQSNCRFAFGSTVVNRASESTTQIGDQATQVERLRLGHSRLTRQAQQRRRRELIVDDRAEQYRFARPGESKRGEAVLVASHRASQRGWVAHHLLTEVSGDEFINVQQRVAWPQVRPHTLLQAGNDDVPPARANECPRRGDQHGVSVAFWSQRVFGHGGEAQLGNKGGATLGRSAFDETARSRLQGDHGVKAAIGFFGNHAGALGKVNPLLSRITLAPEQPKYFLHRTGLRELASADQGFGRGRGGTALPGVERAELGGRGHRFAEQSVGREPSLEARFRLVRERSPAQLQPEAAQCHWIETTERPGEQLRGRFGQAGPAASKGLGRKAQRRGVQQPARSGFFAHEQA